MSYSISKKAKRLIMRFDDAARAHSWLGAKDPESYEEIIKSYKDAKNALYAYVVGLENELGKSVKETK